MNAQRLFKFIPSARVGFFVILGLGIAYRALFLGAFPFAFGHNDSPQYVRAVMGVLAGNSFTPNPIRVMGTYAAFLTGVLKFSGGSGFALVVLQHLLGIVTALMGGGIVRKLTGSKAWGNATLLALCFLPREIIYEHIVLTESLNLFLMMAFLFVAYHIWERADAVRVFGLGVLSAGLLLSRGQGILFIPLGAILLCLVYHPQKVTRLRLLGLSLLYFVPILASAGWYVRANLNQNGYPGLSANANYNLFWVATSNLVKFEGADSPVKALLRSCVLDSNLHYNGDATWAVRAPDCFAATDAVGALYDHNWARLDPVYGQLAREAIWNHPLAFFYRANWNLVDFLKGRVNLFGTGDLLPLLSTRIRPPFEISIEKAESTQKMNELNSPGRANPKAVEALNVALNVFSVRLLTNARFYTFWLYLGLVSVLLFPVPERAALGFGLIVIGGQIAATVIPVNAYYDRYFIAVGSFELMLGFCALAYLFRMNRREKGVAAVRIAAPYLAAKVVMGLVAFLPDLSGLNIDGPILGLPASFRDLHVRYSLALTLGFLAGGLTLYLTKRRRILPAPNAPL